MMRDHEEISNEKKRVQEDEIDFISMAKTLWRDRRIIIITVVIFTFVGLVVALFSQKEYTASTIMVPEINNPSSKLGGLSSLASLAGFNMDMNVGDDAISPMLYPLIISSTKFQLEIMNTEYLFEEMEAPMSLVDYYLDEYYPGLFGILKKYTIGLPELIISAIKGEQPDKLSGSQSETIELTIDQEKVRKIIAKNLSLEVNDNDGYLTLVSRFHQASLSAQVAKKSQLLLREYVTQLKVEKATAQLEFITERYEENRSEFEEAQSKLAAFRDANKNISSEIMRTHEERLENEYQLAFDVYSELAKQLEQSLIKVEEDTPIFSVIDEVTVPNDYSKPKRKLILLLWIFMGIISGISIILGRSFFYNLKKSWTEN